MNPAQQYSPLILAYIGDAVYEVYIRGMLIKDGNMPINELHTKATHYVCAKTQSDIMDILLDKLTPDEIDVYKRGRNTKSTVPKSSSVHHYRRATGFEALIGYLHISGQTVRLEQLLGYIYDHFIRSDDTKAVSNNSLH